jgi:hypothetical protein
MTESRFSSEEAAEELRKRYRYRQLILSGKLTLSHKRAAQLLGPDCLYHLYALEEKKGRSPGRGKTAKAQDLKSAPDSPKAPQRTRKMRIISATIAN